jgi:hypothetical protein
MLKEQKTTTKQTKPAPATAGSGQNNVRFYYKQTAKIRGNEFCNGIGSRADLYFSAVNYRF